MSQSVSLPQINAVEIPGTRESHATAPAFLMAQIGPDHWINLASIAVVEYRNRPTAAAIATKDQDPNSADSPYLLITFSRGEGRMMVEGQAAEHLLNALNLCAVYLFEEYA